MSKFRLIIISLSVAASANATSASTTIRSFFPTKSAALFLVKNLDLTTFRNSLGPRRIESVKTFETLGILPTRVRHDEVILEDDDWFYSLRILRRDDINGDGLEDIEVCFTDRAKVGSYNSQQSILVTRYSASSNAVALKFEVDGCESFAK